MPLGVRRSHKPAAISACGCAPVASKTQRALISWASSPCCRRAPTIWSASRSGAAKRAGANMRAPASTAARHRISSSRFLGNTARRPGTSMRPPRGAIQVSVAEVRASAITASSTPSRSRARCASGMRPSPQTLSRGKAWASTRTTSRPARASSWAAALPAGPAPTMSTSQRSGNCEKGRFMEGEWLAIMRPELRRAAAAAAWQRPCATTRAWRRR